jgi:putative ATP-dependent endonuclease of the OLD family
VRLTFVDIRDYRSIFVDDAGTSLRLDLAEGANTLVGQNNCGKSNVLRAISLALDPNHAFDPEQDTPGPRPFSHPIITLGFCGDRTDAEQAAVLDAADAYERAVDSRAPATRASRGEVVLQVSFVPTASGVRRDERLLTTTDAKQTNEDEQRAKLAEALARLRAAVRFVLISSGESIESVLEGNFREILHSVVRDRLFAEFENAERSRQGYITGLQDSLLRPLRDRLASDVQGLFPEIEGIRLSPEVSSIERTLSNVGVSLEDLVDTPLERKGTGVRGGVLVAMLSYLALNANRGMVFALEEPEAFLHPAAQENLRDHLETLASTPGVTLLVTTHSPFIVTNAARGRVFCLAKDRDGRTRVSDSAAGDADHAPLVGGLLREASLEALLAAASGVPPSAKAVVLLEGEGDRFCIELAAKRVGRPDLLDRLWLKPTSGTVRMIAQAVITRAAVDVPVLVVVDNDEDGRKARQTLVGQSFGFDKALTVTYAAVFEGEKWQQFPVEAEDLFNPTLIERFATTFGPAVVDGTKKRPDGAFHYDLGQAAKESLTEFLESEADPADLHRWIEMILLIRDRAGLDGVGLTADQIIDRAPLRSPIRTTESGTVFITNGAHDLARYMATGAIALDIDYQMPPDVVRVGFYQREISQYLPTIVADHPNLLFDDDTIRQLRSTGKSGDDTLASAIEALVARDEALQGAPHRVLLLSAPHDDATMQLAGPIANTKTMSGRPVAWTVSPRLVPVAAFIDAPATTEELDARIKDLDTP